MALLKSVFEISEICSLRGITQAVICPGSRNAALTLAFARNPTIETVVLSDERSAGFVAMGKAQVFDSPVALLCTSGSAALNFAPAVSEAFFQEIPMLILTADRPPEWINQYDGQTIFQQDIFGKHVKKSYTLPVDISHPDAQWQVQRIVNEAIEISNTLPKGPVHINIPIREPFYPDADESYAFDKKSIKIIENARTTKQLELEAWAQLLEIWEQSKSKLIAVGQNHSELNKLLETLVETENVVVLADIISNANSEDFITNHDVFLGKTDAENLKPTLLITIGKSFISKSFKQFFRKNKPQYHWHIQENPEFFDPLQSLTHKIEVNPEYFLNELLDTLAVRKFNHEDDVDFETDFSHLWQKSNQTAAVYLNSFIKNATFGEMAAVAKIFEYLPANALLHIGNSMPVRYANILQSFLNKPTTVYANRGTSGIDGILSTAMGQALASPKTVFCIIGDVSFFYDINAFWTPKLPQNLKIIVLNNGGGNIFRMIDGPSKQPELQEFFVTHQQNSAKYIADNYAIKYYCAKSINELETAMAALNAENELCILEIFSAGDLDAEIFKSFKAVFLLGN